MQELSVDEKLTNYDTLNHIRLVSKLLNICIRELLDRSDKHDQSKLEQPEVAGFTKATPLKHIVYNSYEYNNNLKLLEETLAHHYARNSHHPQYYKNGINDMTLLDLLEMFCDWKASSLRHNAGNIRKSIEINASKYNINQQLVEILENTATLFDNIKEN